MACGRVLAAVAADGCGRAACDVSIKHDDVTSSKMTTGDKTTFIVTFILITFWWRFLEGYLSTHFERFKALFGLVVMGRKKCRTN